MIQKLALYAARLTLMGIFLRSLVLKVIDFSEGKKGTKMYKDPSSKMENLSMIICPWLVYKQGNEIHSPHDMPKMKDILKMGRFLDGDHLSPIILKDQEEFMFMIDLRLVRCVSIRLPFFEHGFDGTVRII